KFRERVEITTKTVNDGKLSSEQEAVVREALRLSSAVTPIQIINDNKQNNEPKSK
ncbi:MAG: hypothetical protein RLY57_397, partial [Candidatus Parcubacteria bacterium]